MFVVGLRICGLNVLIEIVTELIREVDWTRLLSSIHWTALYKCTGNEVRCGVVSGRPRPISILYSGCPVLDYGTGFEILMLMVHFMSCPHLLGSTCLTEELFGYSEDI